MAPAYQKELDFAITLLKRMRMPVHLVRTQDSMEMLNPGYDEVFGISKSDHATAVRFAQRWSDECTIYKLRDPFACNYIYFHLPDMPENVSVVIGPYLTMDLSREMLLEQAERLGIDVQRMQRQVEYYASLPVFCDPSAIFAIVSCLGESMWGGPAAFRMVDVNTDQSVIPSAARAEDKPDEQENILAEMKRLEMRYAYEDELMAVVSKGLTQRAEFMLSSVSRLNYPNRTGDPLRSMKNYCIICNTLLRKAAQQGGVHPLYLDRMSSQYAYRIENAPTPEKAGALIGDMIRGYTRLVHTHASQQYPSPVQKALAYIGANISGDLSLTGLAKLLQVSPGYLSALFHKETGVTLAEHITAQRMKVALQLLGSTRLQVQNIAQLSGFADPNYFSRQFKRYYGVTPLQYRSEQHNPPGK